MKNSNAAFDNVKVDSDNDENDNTIDDTNECISMNTLINSIVINSKNLTPTSGLSRQHTNCSKRNPIMHARGRLGLVHMEFNI